MEKKNNTPQTENRVSKGLKKVANTTKLWPSVFFMFQPKVPKALKKED